MKVSGSVRTPEGWQGSIREIRRQQVPHGAWWTLEPEPQFRPLKVYAVVELSSPAQYRGKLRTYKIDVLQREEQSELPGEAATSGRPAGPEE